MCKVTPVICPDWEVRVGVADGPVVAGIVGREKYQFDIWGDTVNIAARMASVGNPNVVTMSHGCWLRAGSLYQGRMRGEIEVKGKGTMRVVECSGTK
jgi:class 3 adenylate cyclase